MRMSHIMATSVLLASAFVGAGESSSAAVALAKTDVSAMIAVDDMGVSLSMASEKAAPRRYGKQGGSSGGGGRGGRGCGCG